MHPFGNAWKIAEHEFRLFIHTRFSDVLGCVRQYLRRPLIVRTHCTYSYIHIMNKILKGINWISFAQTLLQGRNQTTNSTDIDHRGTAPHCWEAGALTAAPSLLPNMATKFLEHVLSSYLYYSYYFIRYCMHSVDRMATYIYKACWCMA